MIGQLEVLEMRCRRPKCFQGSTALNYAKLNRVHVESWILTVVKII